MKKLIISITILLSSVVTVCALTSNFFIDSSKLSFYNDNKNSITSNFKNEYNLSYSIKEENEKENKEITSLVKKTTFLLLGGFNNINESNEDYYKRHKDYLNLRYDPVIPKDPSTFSGFDENSQEYKDDLVSGFAVPSLFKTFNEYEIIYNSFGDIRVASSNDIVLASVLLKNVKMKEQNKSNPMLYDTVKTNLIIYYYYKKLDGEYKLYYLHGETTDDLSDYLQTLENQENKQTMQMASTYDSNLKEIYDFSKLEALSEEKLNNIYNNNINNIVILNSYYNNYSIASATGFFINKGLIVTT